MAYNEMWGIPERPLEPIEKKYVPAATDEEERYLRDEFIKEDLEGFFEFVKDLDSTILWDYIESVRWLWKRYKEENRSV